ncbi:MAG: InlB B-repeat-containing protein [Bacteroidales bacterium]|nr:InlB B-repeat-containing protein [Bacteroidales bacterium]
MKNILRYTAALFYVVLALTSCLPEEPVHESINMGAGEVTSLSSSAADLLCEIEDELPKYTKIEYGIIYSDNQEKVENHKGVKKIEGRDLSENRFLVQLTDLKAKQEYFYSSYLRLDEGRIIYGDISSFVTKASYKVTFNANGGKGGMEPQHFEEDDNKALTENTFTREGYEFAGWNTKADGSGQYFHPQQAHLLTDNVNLFAQWQVISGMEEGYTYVDLGLSVEWATRNVGAERREAYGDYFAWGETQTKNNYAWDSYQWGIASDLLTKYCVDAAHGKNGATDAKTTLDLTDDAARVQWKGAWRMPTLAEQKELREKCTWKWKNLNGIAGYEVTGPSGKSIFLPAAGFKNNDAIYQQGSYGCYWSSSLYEIQSDYAYYLNIIPSTREQGQYSRSYGYSVRPVYLTYYCVRFDANQGEGKMDSLMVKKTESLTTPANQFTRDGYIFTAWNTEPDGSGTKVAVQSKFLPTSDTTFYAQWHKVWMLHFDANGGSGTMNPQIFEHGIEQQLIANTFTSTREGYVFAGWNTKADGSGTSYSNQQKISIDADVTLYAQWKKLFYVSFEANGGHGEMGVQTFVQGETKALLACDYTNSGYIFTGWNTEGDGSGTSYSDKQIISVTQDLTLYAQWKRGIYTVTFDANGGTGFMSAQTFEGGVSQALSTNVFTREGFLFDGWNTAPDGSGTSYSDKQIISVTKELTLYAQWKDAPGFENGHDYVDLGLPSGLKWATCNVGATSPEGYGDYFAWGETSPKDNYDWSTYEYCNGSETTLTKYNTKSDYGTVDNKTTLDLSDDAARANWGGKWRMPTTTEQRELINNCTWTWTTQNGVNGYKGTSKTNGNSLFLPAAGFREGTSVYNVGSLGYYWSSSLYEGYPYPAYNLYFYSGYVDWSYYSRDYGRAVRAVCP